MQKIKTPISMKIKTRRDLVQDEKTTVLNDKIVSEALANPYGMQYLCDSIKVLKILTFIVSKNL